MPAPRFHFRTLPTVLTAFMIVVLLGLGFWQLERLEWKTALLARMDAQMTAKSVPLPETLPDPAAWEYRHVSMAGEYDHAKTFFVGPRTLDGKAGFHMVTPFRRASGGTVLVNRGWISEELKPKADRPEGIVQVEGIVQLAKHATFTPDNVPAKNQWYWIDPKAMAEAARLGMVAPVVVALPASPSAVYPAGGAVRIDIPNDHKKYAFFWFSMAVAALAVYILSGLQPAVKLEEKNAGVYQP